MLWVVEYNGSRTINFVENQTTGTLRNEIRVWEDCRIPTIPVRPTRPIALMVHPMMLVPDIMIGNPKRWNSKMELKDA